MPRQIVHHNNNSYARIDPVGKQIDMHMRDAVRNPLWYSRVGNHLVIVSATKIAVARNNYGDDLVPHPPVTAHYYADYRDKREAGFKLIEQVLPADHLLRDKLLDAIRAERQRLVY